MDSIKLLIPLIIFFSNSFLNCLEAQNKPNIIIIMADDLGHSDISLNSAITPTPNIDNFIESNTRLNNFLVAPLCSPTRAGLLTGINPLKIGNGPKTEGVLDPSIMNFGRHFKNNGYRTGFFGKSHNGKSPYRNDSEHHINDYGFDRFVGFYGGGSDYIYKGTVGWYEDKNLVVGNNPTNQSEESHYKYATDLITDKAIEFMNNSVDVNDKPFLCYIPYSAVHTPYTITQEALDNVPNSLKVGINLRSIFDYNKAVLQNTGREWNANKFNDDSFTSTISNLTNEEIKILYSAVTIKLDQNIGRIINFLESKGIDDNTIILFTSDNGANLNGSNLPLSGGKHILYEGGIKVPTAIKIPSSIDITPKQQVNDVCGFLDVFPTLVELAQVDNITSDIDGKSMVDKITGKANSSDNDFFYFSSARNHDALRGNRWKLIRYYDRLELYDLDNDPYEVNNLSNDPNYIDILNNMISKIEEYAIENVMTNGHVPLINPTNNTLDLNSNPDNDIISYPINATAGNLSEKRIQLFKFAGEPGRSDEYLEYDIKISINDLDKDKLEYCYLSHSKNNNPFFNNDNGTDLNGHLLKSKNSVEQTINNWKRIHSGMGNIAPNQFSEYMLVYKFSSPAEAIVFLDNVSVKNFRTTTVEKLFIENSNQNNKLVNPRPSLLTIVDASSTLNISENNTYNKITIDKNPVGNNLYLKGLDFKVNFIIYDVLGKIVKKGETEAPNIINVKSLKSGHYFIQLNKTTSLQFIKE